VSRPTLVFAVFALRRNLKDDIAKIGPIHVVFGIQRQRTHWISPVAAAREVVEVGEIPITIYGRQLEDETAPEWCAMKRPIRLISGVEIAGLIHDDAAVRAGKVTGISRVGINQMEFTV